jgi:anaerobic ribonucleoside-triphosphate reductase activating protein
MEDNGMTLDEDILTDLLEKYKNTITCVCFMGGDSSPMEIDRMAAFVQKNYNLKVGWYSGKSKIPDACVIQHFNYIKLGPYIKHLGGLNSVTTNQRLYRIDDNEMIDMTDCFLIEKRSST